MGRVYDEIITNNKSLHVLFDTGAIHNYITKEAARKLPITTLSRSFDVAIGGKIHNITQACFIDGELQSNYLFYWAFVIDDLGKDEDGKEIDMLFGRVEMQRWNIKVDPKEEKLDLSMFRREFIEY